MQETGEKQKGLVKAVCPRCGLPISWIEKLRRGDRVYVRAVHFLGYVGKRKVVRKCYLGPVESYEYVSHLHRKEDLEFYGLLNTDRSLDYLNKLLDSETTFECVKKRLESGDIDFARNLSNKLAKFLKKLNDLLNEYEKQKNQTLTL